MIDNLIISFESEGITHALNVPTTDINLPYNLATTFTELIKHSDANAEMIIEQLEVKFPSIKADRCDELEIENKELKRFVEGIRAFVKDNKLYMKKGANCPYYQDNPHVCSTFCLECDSCLDVIEDCGVICKETLAAADISFPPADDC